MLSKEDKVFLIALADELSRSVATRTEVNPQVVSTNLERAAKMFQEKKGVTKTNAKKAT